MENPGLEHHIFAIAAGRFIDFTMDRSICTKYNLRFTGYGHFSQAEEHVMYDHMALSLKNPDSAKRVKAGAGGLMQEGGEES